MLNKQFVGEGSSSTGRGRARTEEGRGKVNWEQNTSAPPPPRPNVTHQPTTKRNKQAQMFSVNAQTPPKGGPPGGRNAWGGGRVGKVHGVHECLGMSGKCPTQTGILGHTPPPLGNWEWSPSHYGAMSEQCPPCLAEAWFCPVPPQHGSSPSCSSSPTKSAHKLNKQVLLTARHRLSPHPSSQPPLPPSSSSSSPILRRTQWVSSLLNTAHNTQQGKALSPTPVQGV